MAKAERASVRRISGDWLARDGAAWRVRVPCPGGSGLFTFKEHGGSQGALEAAQRFQVKAVRLLEADRAYFKKHGEKLHREVLPINNKTGIVGVRRVVQPNKEQKPNIVYFASYYRNKVKFEKGFSTYEYGTEDKAREAAIAFRKDHPNKY